jgi:hypothetical protein
MEEPNEQVRTERVKQFRDIAGDDLDEDTCAALLASNDWNVETTARNFFEGPNSPKYGGGNHSSTSGVGATTTTTTTTTGNESGENGAGIETSGLPPDFDAQAAAAFQQVFGVDDDEDDDEGDINNEAAAFLGGVRARRGRGFSPDRDSFNFQPSGAVAGRTRNSVLPPLPSKPISILIKEAFTGQSSESSASAARRFAAEFDKIVGADSSAPEFFESSFEDALLSASTERRMLAVYLHSPLHPMTDFFCREVLCSRLVLNALADVRVWGGSIDHVEGYLASTKVQAAGFPCIVLIATDRGRDAKIVDRLYIDDPSEPNLPERFAARIAAARNFRPQPAAAAAPVDQREVDERRRVVEEQDAALRQAMEEDRRRAEEKRERERAEEAERQRKIQEEKRKEEEFASKRARIRPEPDASTPEIANIRFQFPGGSKILRRFNGSDTVGYVRDVLDIHLVDVLKTPSLRYALMLNYPKKTLEDNEVSLKDAGLVPQAVVFLQDLDA